MVMFVLADYHNTAQKLAWPSIPTLAREALMTERTIYRILESLEGTRLRRIVAAGRPNVYQFIGLDTPDIKSVLEKVTPDTTPDMTPDKFGTAIRKEEPVLEPVNKPPYPPFSKSVIQKLKPDGPDSGLICSNCGKYGAFRFGNEAFCSRCVGRVPKAKP